VVWTTKQEKDFLSFSINQSHNHSGCGQPLGIPLKSISVCVTKTIKKDSKPHFQFLKPI
jgi:hypothetical protein